MKQKGITLVIPISVIIMLDSPFRVVVVHEHHGDGDAEHHHAADNDLLAMVVFALDVTRILFVEFLEGRALVQLGRVDAVRFRDFFVSHVQRTDVSAIVLVELVCGRSGKSEDNNKQKKNAKGTRYKV